MLPRRSFVNSDQQGSELTFLRLLPERAFTFERGAEEFAKSYRINLRLLPELAFSFEHDDPQGKERP